MGDFSTDQGGTQSSSSTEAPTRERGVEKSGVSEAPKGEIAFGEPGPGSGNTRSPIR